MMNEQKILEATIPFIPRLMSKNAIYTISQGENNKPQIILRRQIRHTKNIIYTLLKQYLKPFKVEQSDRIKVFIKITIFRKNFNFDPVNAVDLICDIIKDLIQIDDRYFSITVDWEYDKSFNNDMKIEISLINIS